MSIIQAVSTNDAYLRTHIIRNVLHQPVIKLGKRDSQAGIDAYHRQQQEIDKYIAERERQRTLAIEEKQEKAKAKILAKQTKTTKPLTTPKKTTKSTAVTQNTLDKIVDGVRIDHSSWYGEMRSAIEEILFMYAEGKPENYTPFSREEEQIYTAILTAGNRNHTLRDHNYYRAFNQLLQHNILYIISLAKNYQDPRVPLKDLIQEGMIALARSLETFDDKHNVKVITYAVRPVAYSIATHFYGTGKQVRITTSALLKIKKVDDAIATFESKHKKAPTVEEIAEILLQKPEIIEEIAGYKLAEQSLDTPIKYKHDDSDPSLLEVFVPTDADNAILFPEDSLFQRLETVPLHIARDIWLSNILTPKEAYLVREVNGITKAYPASLEEMTALFEHADEIAKLLYTALATDMGQEKTRMESWRVKEESLKPYIEFMSAEAKIPKEGIATLFGPRNERIRLKKNITQEKLKQFILKVRKIELDKTLQSGLDALVTSMNVESRYAVEQILDASSKLYRGIEESASTQIKYNPMTLPDLTEKLNKLSPMQRALIRLKYTVPAYKDSGDHVVEDTTLKSIGELLGYTNGSAREMPRMMHNAAIAKLKADPRARPEYLDRLVIDRVYR